MDFANTPYAQAFSANIALSIDGAAQILRAYPKSAGAFLRIAGQLPRAQVTRNCYAEQGLGVPPLMIVSTTNLCNLSCAGCYASAQIRQDAPMLTKERIEGILEEAAALGVSITMLAGGEPLLAQDWLDALGQQKTMAGIVFTNGTLMDEERLSWFGAHRHVLPAISLEGDARQTDARRGSGVYAAVQEAMGNLAQRGIPFGVSVTVTTQNIDEVLSDGFITQLMGQGCRFFVHVEYVPVAHDTRQLVLLSAQKKRLVDFTRQAAKRHAALFIPFPGDEGEYGGCLAAGRGFIHISAAGDVEACPFAPFSDTNLGNATLESALRSALLKKIRDNHHLLKEGEGGCALWNNIGFIEKLKEG